MQITIRQAKVGDASGIAAVQIASWKSTYSGIVPSHFLVSMNLEVQTKMWESQLTDDNNLIFVAEDELGLIGFASGGKLREIVGDYDAELYAIYLMPEKQRQGIGRVLMLKLVLGLRTKGLKKLLVWVLEKNPSVGFYECLGGTKITHKSIQIGGVDLQEIAFGWPSLDLENISPCQ